MAYVHINPDNNVLLGVYTKLTPYIKLGQYDKLVEIFPADYDKELYSIVYSSEDPYFTIVPKPQEVQLAVIQERKTAVIQKYLDDQAAQLNYDGILSAASYLGSNDPKFGPEGASFHAWRDAVWNYGYQVIYEVQNGIRTMPTDEELLAELPVYSAT